MDKMPLEQQVVSLELSKQLKEIGYPQEGIFKWTNYTEPGGKTEHWELEPCYDNHIMTIDCISPTVAELGEALPYCIGEPYLNISKDVENYYNVHYGSKVLVTGTGMGNALAKMWLYLKKEGLL